MCSAKTCNVRFHLACAIDGNSYMNFKTLEVFCKKHSKYRKNKINSEVFRKLDESIAAKVNLDDFEFGSEIPMTAKMIKEKVYDKLIGKTQNSCSICFEMKEPHEEIIFLPCCFGDYITNVGDQILDVYLHRKCVQKTAYNFGYKFKCVFCLDTDYLIPYLEKIGIYVPKRYPLWEDSQYENRTLIGVDVCCSIENCLHSDDRYFHNDNEFFIFVCCTCGSNGAHKICLGITQDTTITYLCNDCNTNRTMLRNAIENMDDEDGDLSTTSSDDDDVYNFDRISVHSSGSEKHEWSADDCWTELDKNYPVIPKPIQDPPIRRPQRALLGYPIFYV